MYSILLLSDMMFYFLQTLYKHIYVHITMESIYSKILGSIVVSISACHVEDPGSIPGRGAFFFFVFIDYFFFLPTEFSVKRFSPPTLHIQQIVLQLIQCCIYNV